MELERMTALGGLLDDPRPILDRDVSAVAPLADGDALLTDVRRHRLGVPAPGIVNFGQVRHDRL